MKMVYYCKQVPYEQHMPYPTKFEGFHAPWWTKFFLWMAGWKPMPCACHFNK
jgi:hypothetical protein